MIEDTQPNRKTLFKFHFHRYQVKINKKINPREIQNDSKIWQESYVLSNLDFVSTYECEIRVIVVSSDSNACKTKYFYPFLLYNQCRKTNAHFKIWRITFEDVIAIFTLSKNVFMYTKLIITRDIFQDFHPNLKVCTSKWKFFPPHCYLHNRR